MITSGVLISKLRVFTTLETAKLVSGPSSTSAMRCLNENIDYYLKEDNEQRKYNYHKEVRRCLKNIAMITVRNVIDLPP